MSEYWNLANKNDAPMTYKQFLALSFGFKDIAEHEFSTPCDVTVRLMNSTKANDNFDMGCDYKTINEEKVTLETNHLSDISETLWADARYVDVTVQPKDKNKEGFALAEFKGDLPMAASFYVQHYNDRTAAKIKKDMMVENKKMLVGDGSKCNSGGFGPAIFARNEAGVAQIKAEMRQGPRQSFAGFVLGVMGFSS